MKLLNKGALLIATLAALTTFGQKNETLDDKVEVKEFVLVNPVLISGTDKQEGAVYRFANASTGIDAILTINKIYNCVVNTIDLTQYGWQKAFQPEIGQGGNVPAYSNWWARFNIAFVETGTMNKKKIGKFYASAIDVDGDNLSIQEYIQMYAPDSVRYCNPTYLYERPAFDAGIPSSNARLSQGPIQNYWDIDTTSYPVMVVYTFMNRDNIDFCYGAKSNEHVSNAGLRLNSLWFKSFNLVSNTVLPVKLKNFAATYDKNSVQLNWSTSMEANFSHFVIERSTDGKNFSQVALYFSAESNSSQSINYAFRDKTLPSNVNMVIYRLRMVDKTNETTYSSIRIVRLKKEAGKALEISTYPNPVTDQLRVTLPDAWQGKTVQLDLYTFNGTKVQSMQISSANQVETMKLGNITRGFYLIKATCENEVAQQKVIKN